MKADLLPTLNPLSQIFLNLPPKTQTNHSTQSSLGKLPAGAKTIGNYLLGKNIGQGTFGKVHLALHLPTSEKVAIKIIDKTKMRPKDIQRVQHEIQVLKHIRHRHVVTLYEIIQTEKSLLLVTQFLPNGELFRHIIKEKRLLEDEACTYFQQIIETVDYLHRNKIAHRDLKPENILIDYDKQLKVIDFGLSTFYQGRRQLNTFCGSPCYAAPEMIEAKDSYSPLQVDLWSCGVILFAMLCGHLPFCDADTHTLFKKILACSYKIPSYVSPQAQDLIKRLLVLSPNDRITLQEIKEHKWYNKVTGAAAYGLDIGEQLPPDINILDKMRYMGLDVKKLQEDVASGHRSKDMATYLILMKKMVKNDDLIPSYIGNDNFNPKLIIRTQDKLADQQDTQSYNGPDSSHIIVPTPEAPEVPKMGEEIGPLAGTATWWFEQHKEIEIKDIDEEELMLLAGSILNLFLPKIIIPTKPEISQINEVLTPTENSSNPIKRLAIQKRESQFYSHNAANAKKLFTFAGIQRSLKKDQKASFLSAYRNQIKSSVGRISRYNSSAVRSVSKREKTQPHKNNILKISLQALAGSMAAPQFKRNNEAFKLQKLQKKFETALPSLPQRVQQLKSQAKTNYFNKKYKIYKNLIH